MQSFKAVKLRADISPSHRKGSIFMHLLGWMTGGVVPCVGRSSWAKRLQAVRVHIVDGTLPMKPFILATCVFYVIVAVYGAYLGKHMDGIVDRSIFIDSIVASTPDFTVHNVDIRDNFSTEVQGRRDEVLEAFGTHLGVSIFSVDIGAVNSRLYDLSWVESSSVQRMLPNVIRIVVTERKPLAIWQHNQELAVIDNTGHVITRDITKYNRIHLPFFVGEGANLRAGHFMKEMDKYPELYNRVHAIIRVADRRWNVHLANGISIKLPASMPWQAMSEVIAFDDAYDLLDSNLTLIDLRIPDRITVRLASEDALLRRKMLQDKHLKRTRKSHT